jgi:MOSC domain-containing protein YiiM
MQPLAAVQAVPAKGLVNDRYADGVGFYSGRPTDPGAREVTLFESETLDWLSSECRIAFSAAEHRRNLTTHGVRLNSLLGQRFRVGEVLLEGVRDCPPCEHLEKLTSKLVLQPLVGRGGLRARVLEGGTIRIGDPIALEAAESAPAPTGYSSSVTAPRARSDPRFS